jgi:hypothetical protein
VQKDIEVPSTVTEPPFEQYLAQHTLWPETNKLYGHGFELVTITCSHKGDLVASSSKVSILLDQVPSLSYTLLLGCKSGSCSYTHLVNKDMERGL